MIVNRNHPLRHFYAGYFDAIEETPGKRADCEGYVVEINGIENSINPEVVLYLCKEQAPKEINDYWSGWQAGLYDSIRKTLNQ